MLVTSNLSITSNLRLGALGFQSFLESLCRRSRRLLSSFGSRNLVVFSRIEVSELLLGRRSRDGSAKMLNSPCGPLGFPAGWCRCASDCGGSTRDPGGAFSGLVLTPLV